MRPTDGTSFDAFLAELARAPDAPVSIGHLPESLLATTVVDDRYRIESFVGRGGMGEVYRALDIELGRPVAIKLSLRLGEETQRQWQREAEALAKLSHPNVVEVFRVGNYGGRMFIAMAWIDGETLADWAGLGGRPWAEVLDRYRRAGAGLAAAHAVGLVHRDFKPQNVLLGRDGRVLVADFGLVASPRPPETHEVETPLRSTSERFRTASRSTRGAVGTPGYMPPEQFAGHDPDPRGDQFSFCAALFEGLFGRLPYGGGRPARIYERMLAGEITDVPRGDVPGWLVRALHRGLRRARVHRFADMQELLAAIDPARHQRRRRRIGAMLATVVAFGVATAVLVGAPTEPCAATGGELESAWNERRADELGRAFIATGSSLAEASSAHAIASLDDRAAAWADLRRAACDAAVAGGDVEAQVACLQRARNAFEASVDVLLHADREVVVRTHAVIDALPEPEECVDATVSMAAEPRDPDALRAVREARLHVARANAELYAGRVIEALAEAGKAVVLAEQAGFEPAIAEALLARGSALADAGHAGDGVADLKDAYWKATAEGQDAIASDAARRVLQYMAADPRQWDETQAWSGFAEAAERRLGEPEPTPSLHRARGDAAYLAERYEESRMHFERALAQLVEEPDEVAARVGCYNALATLAYIEGDMARARRLGERALASARETPSDVRTLAGALEVYARSLSHAGRPDEAIAPIREALELNRRMYGPSGPDAVQALDALGDVLLRNGDPQEALVAYEEAVVVAEQRDPIDWFEVAASRSGMGNALTVLERYAEAEAALQRSVEAYRQGGGETTFNLAAALMRLARARAGLGDFETAIADHNRGLEIYRAALPPDSPTLAGTMADGAALLVEAGQFEQALAVLDDAAARVERGGGSAELRAMVQALRAECHIGSGRRAQAVSASTAMLSAARELGTEPSADLLELLHDNAQLLLRAEEPALARDVIVEAQTVLDRTGPSSAVTQAMLTLALAEATRALQ